MKLDLEKIKEGFLKKDKIILSKGLSLIENRKKENQDLIYKFLSSFSLQERSKVIGVSGTPGAGKSTFLNTFIKELVDFEPSLKVAVLAIDPSSEVSGGSILGDKTRMNDISHLEQVYIRPSASDKYLGGVAAKTYESIRLCEVFGFDYIFVETVGVGQSESLVAHMVDYFIMLSAPAGGDDLQGIKRGVLEHIDLLLINKADGDMLDQAQLALSHFSSSSDLVSKKSAFKTLMISGLKKIGIKEVENEMRNYFKTYDFSKREVNRSRFVDSFFKQIISEKIENIFNSSDYKSIVTSFTNDDISMQVLSEKLRAIGQI